MRTFVMLHPHPGLTRSNQVTNMLRTRIDAPNSTTAYNKIPERFVRARPSRPQKSPEAPVNQLANNADLRDRLGSRL